jgi:hypothetical protein
MNREQINQLYAQTPVLLWPWIWVQLIVILARMEAASLRGEDSTILIGVTHWFTLHILYQSDNLSGNEAPQAFTYDGNVTFASLCEPICAAWTPFNATNVLNIASNDNARHTHHTAKEYAEALRPVP